MDELATAITELPPARVFEAADLLNGTFDVPVPADATREAEAFVATNQLDDVADLARLMLLTAAGETGTRELVREAVDGSGSKQFVFGGAELIPIIASAITFIRVERVRKWSYKYNKNRDVTGVQLDESWQLNLSPKLAGVLKALVPDDA